MITVITGAPGSGKTLYTIAKLLKAILGTFVDATDDDGNKVKHPRTIYTNINGLTMEHEKIDAEWLADWPNRVKPGALICYDEAQKPWPKRVTGSKVPPAVAELETHRHHGVDFVVMTQKPELLDQNVCSLAGRHLHIRRVGNSHNVIVYEWDAVSRGLLYKNAFKKSTWRYPRWVFDLYKSAEAHTKMPRSVPFAIWIALAAVAGSAYAWPALLDKITDGLNPSAKRLAAEASQKGAQPTKLSTPSLIVPDAPEPVLAGPNTRLAALAPIAPAAPALMGCVATPSACRCYDQAGLPVELEVQACQAKLSSPMPAKTAQDLAQILPGVPDVKPPAAAPDVDGQVIGEMRAHAR